MTTIAEHHKQARQAMDKRDRINAAIRTALSPRFLPDAIYQVPEVPRTLSGKKMEVPVKKILLGHPPERCASRDAMANPAAIDWFVAFARGRGAGPAAHYNQRP